MDTMDYEEFMSYLEVQPMVVGEHNIFTVKPYAGRRAGPIRAGRGVACETCSADFENETRLWVHVRQAHADVRQLACPVKGCGKRFSARAHRTGHLAHHGGLVDGNANDRHRGTAVAAERPDTCELCGKLYASRRLLHRHVGRAHPEARGMSCGVCTLMVRDERTMSRHVKRAHAAEMTGRGPVRCPVCAMVCGNRALLSRHAQVHEATRLP